MADREGVARGRAGDVDAKDGCRGEEGEILPQDVDEMDLGQAKWNVCTPEIVGNGACGRGKKEKEARETAANDRSVEDEFRNAWTDVARQFVMEGGSDRLRGEDSPHELEAVEKKQERNDGRPPLKRRLLGSPPSKSVKKTSSQGLLDVGRFVKKICMELNEPKQPLMRRCVDHLGIDYVQELLDEVQKVERDGGQMTSDGDRKRTPGGVFWNLLKQRLAAEEWEYIYAEEKERQKAIKRRQHSLRRRRKSGNMDVDEVSPPITPTSRDGKTFAEAVGAGGI